MDSQILTRKEFAKRLKISQTTEFEWRRKGFLKEGRHYFRHERTIRYIWADWVALELLGSSPNPDNAPPDSIN